MFGTAPSVSMPLNSFASRTPERAAPDVTERASASPLDAKVPALTLTSPFHGPPPKATSSDARTVPSRGSLGESLHPPRGIVRWQLPSRPAPESGLFSDTPALHRAPFFRE